MGRQAGSEEEEEKGGVVLVWYFRGGKAYTRACAENGLTVFFCETRLDVYTLSQEKTTSFDIISYVHIYICRSSFRSPEFPATVVHYLHTVGREISWLTAVYTTVAFLCKEGITPPAPPPLQLRFELQGVTPSPATC